MVPLGEIGAERLGRVDCRRARADLRLGPRAVLGGPVLPVPPAEHLEHRRRPPKNQVRTMWRRPEQRVAPEEVPEVAEEAHVEGLFVIGVEVAHSRSGALEGELPHHRMDQSRWVTTGSIGHGTPLKTSYWLPCSR